MPVLNCFVLNTAGVNLNMFENKARKARLRWLEHVQIGRTMVVRVLGVVLGSFIGCFPCSCSVLSPGFPACFSLLRSRLLLLSINPFLRPRWPFPVCIRALIKLNPNNSEGGAAVEDLHRGRQETGYRDAEKEDTKLAGPREEFAKD